MSNLALKEDKISQIYKIIQEQTMDLIAKHTEELSVKDEVIA